METPAACEIERLPEDLLVHVISLTSPTDAFRAAAVSRAFQAAADSDTVWSRFLPRDLPRFAKKELTRTPPSTKKGLFRRLSDEPVLLPHKFMRMQLNKATGAKCLTISASALQIPGSPWQHNWIRVGLDFNYSKRGKRFLHAVELAYVGLLEIRAKVQCKMLSQNTTYVAHMVFKLADRFYGLDLPFQEASLDVAGSESKRRICLQGYLEEGHGDDEPPRKHILLSYYRGHETVSIGEDVVFPRKKVDGWMEVELGEFHNGEGDGEVSVSITEKTPGPCKQGLILWGIEFRSKHIGSQQEIELH